MPPQDAAEPIASVSPWIIAIAALVAIVVLLVFWVLRKSRPVAGEHVFRASRMSEGNRLFPAQVAITPASVTLYKPQWVGKLEESIHMAHISSIKIDTNLMFSDVFIETSGGQNPVVCHGHSKGDAIKMKSLIEQFQTDYYKQRTT
jgi:hypothetical protein